MNKVRTSETDPLQMPTLNLPWLPGRIGMTICPGKQGDSLLGSRWKRDLKSDLQAIRQWGASLIVTLMEEQELHLLVPGDLAAEITALGMQSLLLPIRDGDVPGANWERRWRNEVGPELRDRLLCGEKILVHCRGGLGRTGLLVALLLKDLGLNASEAIPMIRRVRPGAIETSEQEAYVRNYTTWAGRQTLPHYQGCMLGGAIGDALGWPVEFSSLKEIRSSLGAQGVVGPLSQENELAQITDDTQMSLFTAEGLLLGHKLWEKGNHSAITDQVHRAYLRWLYTQGEDLPEDRAELLQEGNLLQHRELFARRAPGTTCIAALKSGLLGTPAVPINASKGCGTVMRVAPIGLFIASPGVLPYLPQDEIDQTAFRFGCEISALTHGHPSGWLAGGYLALLTARLLLGDDLLQAIQTCMEELTRHPGHEECLAAIQKALKLHQQCAPSAPETIEQIGAGWVAEEALAIALFCCLSHPDDFIRAVQLAVNHSGDSDSTGAITGNILGTLLGTDSIPGDWLECLEMKSLIRKTGECLYIGEWF